jgi:hypothetical protein
MRFWNGYCERTAEPTPHGYSSWKFNVLTRAGVPDRNVWFNIGVLLSWSRGCGWLAVSQIVEANGVGADKAMFLEGTNCSEFSY